MSTNTKPSNGFKSLYLKEDWWAVWIGLGTVLLSLILFYMGASLKPIAVKFKAYESFSELPEILSPLLFKLVILFVVLAVVFAIAVAIMGKSVSNFLKGFALLYVLAILVQILGAWQTAKDLNLEAPVLALILGMVLGNFIKIPEWFDAAMRTEFYVKTGIVLMGATLPFTIILQSGPTAFMQATVIAVTTFVVIYFVGSKVLGLDKRFASTLGAGGSICGVSASIAIGSSVNAKKEHVSVSISMVVVWATIMVFALPWASHAIGLSDGAAGAWIGTSEFADAAGIAAAAQFGDGGIETFTLMKVVGRDIFVGVWAFILAIISVTLWEAKEDGTKPSAGVIWERFPKFVLGFFVASLIVTFVQFGMHDQADNLKGLEDLVIKPIKTLRGWAFVLCFLCIGLTTRFRELTAVGWKPFAAFTSGVVVNVILGYLFSTVILGEYWTEVGMQAAQRIAGA